MSQEEMRNWIKSKANESTFLKTKLYSALITENGFEIRRHRLNNSQGFFPKITADFTENKRLNIQILISFWGTLFFSIFWFLAPIIIITSEKAKINGVEKTMTLDDKLYILSFLYVVIIPLTLIFLIWPIFSSRDWIEKELILSDRKKIGSS